VIDDIDNLHSPSLEDSENIEMDHKRERRRERKRKVVSDLDVERRSTATPLNTAVGIYIMQNIPDEREKEGAQSPNHELHLFK
jgi:hypothetical protein